MQGAQKHSLFIGLMTFMVIILGLISFHVSRLAAAATPSPSTEVAQAEENTQTLPGGAVSFRHAKNFGLAVKPEQVLAHSFIPVCQEGFDYCLYYNGSDYQNTNFDSAGISVTVRSDLSSKVRCMNDQPLGFTNLSPEIEDNAGYSTSGFIVGNAATGHYSTGQVHRLWHGEGCYEFETRVNESRFANYPTGTIDEFTQADKHDMQSMLTGIMESILVTDGSHPFAESEF